MADQTPNLNTNILERVALPCGGNCPAFPRRLESNSAPVKRELLEEPEGDRRKQETSIPRRAIGILRNSQSRTKSTRSQSLRLAGLRLALERKKRLGRSRLRIAGRSFRWDARFERGGGTFERKVGTHGWWPRKPTQERPTSANGELWGAFDGPSGQTEQRVWFPQTSQFVEIYPPAKRIRELIRDSIRIS